MINGKQKKWVLVCAVLTSWLTIGAVYADEFTKADTERWQQEFMDSVKQGPRIMDESFPWQ